MYKRARVTAMAGTRRSTDATVTTSATAFDDTTTTVASRSHVHGGRLVAGARARADVGAGRHVQSPSRAPRDATAVASVRAAQRIAGAYAKFDSGRAAMRAERERHKGAARVTHLAYHTTIKDVLRVALKMVTEFMRDHGIERTDAVAIVFDIDDTLSFDASRSYHPCTALVKHHAIGDGDGDGGCTDASEAVVCGCRGLGSVMRRLHNKAVALGYQTHLITAREDSEGVRKWTESEMDSLRILKWTSIHYCPAADRTSSQSISEFKRLARAKIEACHAVRVALTIGDQYFDHMSDTTLQTILAHPLVHKHEEDCLARRPSFLSMRLERSPSAMDSNEHTLACIKLPSARRQ